MDKYSLLMYDDCEINCLGKPAKKSWFYHKTDT